MKRLRKKIDTWGDAVPAVRRPCQIKHPPLTREEHLFCWLYSVIGLTQAEAYKTAFVGSSAKMVSCSAMASRLLQTPEIISYINRIDRYYSENQLEIKLKI